MGKEAWALAEADMQRFSGSMAANASTWNGKLDQLRKKVSESFAAFGEPIIDSCKPLLDKLISLASTVGPQIAAIGKAVGDTFTVLIGAFKGGQLGTLIATSLKIGFGEAVNFLTGALTVLVKAIPTILTSQFRIMGAYLSGDFIMGVAKGFEALGAKIMQILMTAFETPIKYMQAGIQWAIEKALGSLPGWAKKLFGMDGFEASSFGDILANTDAPTLGGQTAADFGAQSADAFREAGAAFAKPLETILDAQKDVFLAFTDFKPADIFNTGADKALLAGLSDGILAARQQIATASGATGGTADEDGPWAGAGKRAEAPRIEADAMTKVGLIMADYGAGASTPEQTEQRRTNELVGTVAGVTSEVVTLLKQIINKMPTGGTTGGEAVWA